MKKLFIITALFAAAFAQAQLTPDYTDTDPHIKKGVYGASFLFSPYNTLGEVDRYRPNFPNCPFFVRIEEINSEFFYVFINPFDYSVYKTINTNFFNNVDIYAAAYDIFAVDKLAFFLKDNNDNHLRFIDEDGNVLLDFGDDVLTWHIAKYGSTWKLLLNKGTSTIFDGDNTTSVEVYNFPGDGSEPQIPTNINPSPTFKHTARKIARDGQVLVETENNTYTLQGQEIR